MEKKLSVSVVLPIKSALAKDFDEYFSKAIEIDDMYAEAYLARSYTLKHLGQEGMAKLDAIKAQNLKPELLNTN